MADSEPMRLPVPKPRRIHTPTAYENVSLDAINKNIILNTDNLQTTLKPKVPNNKQFMQTTTTSDGNHNQQQSPPEYRSVITEINNLNLDKPDKNSSNKNFADSHKLKNMPVPAPRRLHEASSPTNDDIYENNEESQLAAQEIYESNEDPPTSPNSSTASSSLSGSPLPSSTPTGAIRKAPRRPPQIPLPPPPTNTPPKQKNNQQTTSSGVLVDDCTDDVVVKNKLEKSKSNGSVSSSTSGGSSGAKFNTTSPGSLLKALGSTSRQLTESITERVAVRTKGATHKLDKIQQSSRDIISDTTRTAGSRLLNVSKSLHQSSLDRLKNTKRSLQNVRQSIGMKIIGDNMSLDRKHKSTKSDDIPEEYDTDRSHANNEAFQSISFQSQLKTKEATISYDMSDASYEVPRSHSMSEGGVESPPSYRELYKTLAEDDDAHLFNRNSALTQSAGYMGYRRSENIPYPKFPPPILGPQKKELQTNSPDSQYTVMSPVRNTRSKDYEETQIRFKVKIPEVASNRATADPSEFAQLDESEDRQESCFSRNIVSADLSEVVRLEEQNLPSPSRSESWAFYDTTPGGTTHDDADSNSSPEPIYVNNETALAADAGEAIYGAVYTTKESPGGTLLTPVTVPRKKHSAKIVSTVAVESSNAILKEFDPMDWSAVDQMFSSKSNELILLESLLAEDTYGTLTNVSSVDLTDDEESEESIEPTTSTTQQTSTATKATQEERKSIIVHQNLKLHAFDLADEDAAVAPFLAKCEPKPATSQSTNWFVDTQLSSNSSPKKDDKPTSGAAPPPYTENQPEISQTDEKRSNKFTSIFNVFHKRKNSFNKTLSPTIDKSKSKSDLNSTIEMLPRPMLTQRLTLHEGTIIRLPSKAVDDILKEQHRAMAFIRDRRFQVYTDKEMKSPKENIPLENIVAIQCVSQHKFTNNAVELHCFEVTTVTPKHSEPAGGATSPTKPGQMLRTTHLYGVAKESDRFIWMQKLLEGITDVFQTSHTCRFYRAGWCYLKNSITSQWSGAWIALHKHKKRLICYTTNDMNLEVLDLRKARCLILKESDESVVNLPVEAGPLLMIDCPPYSMYMAMCSARETKIWRHIIVEVAHNNGPSLKEQQLTKGDVSVLVDKCVNFVYTHGSMSEGIYRKSGSENAIQRLLQLFRADAFGVQLTRSEYTEHDVANALKRFMRDLPESMLGRHAASFISVAAMQSSKDKLAAYKELLARLPAIEYQTLRKLIGHLNFIQSQAPRNKMHVENLSIVWGPTLLEDKQNLNEMQFSQMESQVIVDLVLMYKNLYQLTPDEVSKEKTMLAVLQKYHAAAENLSDSVKHSGDLKVWITIDSNPDDELEEKTQINVTLTPTKTVYDVCKELAPRMKREAVNVTLNEYILDGDLYRPMHHSEKVFDVVLKWSYWPEADRKNNYLRLQPMKLMKNVIRALRNLPIVSPSKELKFADSRTKALRSMQLELTDARITVMKKEKGNSMVGVRELDLRTMTTYLGSEKKRDCQQRWALTFVENQTKAGEKCVLRTRESPFFGHIIAGSDTNDSLVWFSSILHGLYGDDLMPEAEIIIT